MGELRESSVLFSLNQLMHIERQRLLEEEETARRRAEAAVAARLDAERRAREEREARLRAAESRLRAEEAEQREMEARLAAIRLAELEKVRIDAERRERIALMEQANEHERKLAALQQDEQKKRLKRILVAGSALVAVLFTAGSGIYFGQIRPAAELRQQQEEAELRAREAELARLKADYEQAVAQADRTSQALLLAKDAAERIKATRAAEDAKKAAEDARTSLARGGRVRPPSSPSTPCTCANPNDPLCGCLPR